MILKWMFDLIAQARIIFAVPALQPVTQQIETGLEHIVFEGFRVG
jgi:hypothetical protein